MLNESELRQISENESGAKRSHSVDEWKIGCDKICSGRHRGPFTSGGEKREKKNLSGLFCTFTAQWISTEKSSIPAHFLLITANGNPSPVTDDMTARERKKENCQRQTSTMAARHCFLVHARHRLRLERQPRLIESDVTFSMRALKSLTYSQWWSCRSDVKSHTHSPQWLWMALVKAAHCRVEW